MAGRVIRRNVAKADAPSVDAACSCSVPISLSTGTTSRTTNGSATKIVARIIPGSAKITCRPCRSSHGPNHPSHGSSRSEEHTSELQSRFDLVCRLLLDKKKYRLEVNHYV